MASGLPLLMAWRHRGLLVRVLAAAAILFMLVPMAAGVLVVAAVGGAMPAPADPTSATAPMPYWTVTQEFGCTGLYFEPAYAGCPHFHSGIDLAAASGTPVAAVLPGTATVTRSSTGYGLRVVLAHPGGLSTLYAHLGAVTVVSGEVVEPGTVIGLEGSSGNSTGPHLHFEVRRNGIPFPPRQVFPGIFSSGQTNGSASPAPRGRAM